MDNRRDREVLFRILLDDEAQGLTLIQGAPIHSCDDLRRARAEMARSSRVPLRAASPRRAD